MAAFDDLLPELRRAFDADRELAERLRSLRGQNRPIAVTAIAEALHRGYERESLTLLGRLEPYFTEVLIDQVVRTALILAETHRVRYLLGRLPHRRARELVGPAVSHVLETETDDEAWIRMAELLDHLGLQDQLHELSDPSNRSAYHEGSGHHEPPTPQS